MPPVRPCIERLPEGKGCPLYALEGKSRCAEHEREYQGQRKTPSQKIAQTARWRKLRARVIREQKRRDGTWQCEICLRPITDEREIDLDHVMPVAMGGEPYDETNVRLSHRHCNRSRKRPRGPKPGSDEWWAARGGRPR